MKMEHNINAGDDKISALLTLLLSAYYAFIAWISIKDALLVLAAISTCISIFAGLLAARYYWFSGSKAKKELENKKNKL